VENLDRTVLTESGRFSWEMVGSEVPGLVVSIHDVCPATWDASQAMVADLISVGVKHISLLVVPHYHHGRKVGQELGFGAWLREMVRQGHEVVQHGYFHQRVSTTKLHGWRRLVATHYTVGEGEFFDLTLEEARPLLQRGQDELSEVLGFAPVGFIAPAWLLHPTLESCLPELGLRYTTRIDGIYEFPRQRFFPARSLVYSARAAWRRTCSLGWNALLAARLAEDPLLRLGLHPPDWEFSALREQALKIARQALASRPALTYEVWLATATAGK
jgi:uncharacterized protein